MFQIVGELTHPLVTIVRTLDEVFARLALNPRTSDLKNRLRANSIPFSGCEALQVGYLLYCFMRFCRSRLSSNHEVRQNHGAIMGQRQAADIRTLTTAPS
jgi:hypothetical protein